MKIDIETLRKTKGIGSKTLERIIKQHYIDEDIKVFESKYIESKDYRIDKNINLWQGDCLELMSYIPDKSVDMVLADLPYGTTACSWDEIIPFEPLWSHYKRIIKDNGAIVLFGSEPFSTKLRMSNLDWYKYDWYWNKVNGSNFISAKKIPLKNIEQILVFYRESCIYNPQLMDAKEENKRPRGRGNKAKKDNPQGIIGEYVISASHNEGKRYPKTLLTYNNREGELNALNRKHSAQKPVKLLEYLVKTYTNENMLVLDNTMGSGSTGVACKNLNRKFIGIELDEEYFNIAKNRIYNTYKDSN